MMFYKEANFKDTSVGRIPEDWEIVEIKNYLLSLKYHILRSNKQ